MSEQLMATSYFEELTDLLCNTHVTDAKEQTMDVNSGSSSFIGWLKDMINGPGKVIVIGNGGSAAIASHIQTDLAHGVGMRAQVYYEPSWLTASANDYGYETVFERGATLWAESGDILLAISSSGRSQNILRGVTACREKGCRIVTFSGFDSDNPLRQLGDLNFYVQSHSYGYVEMAHEVLGHYITDMLKLIIKSKE